MIESSIHPHVPEERADLFEAEDSQSTEQEYLEFLAGLVRVLKPRRILETGTHRGFSCAVMAEACRQNNLGHVDSLERDPKRVEEANRRLRDQHLDAWADVHESESVPWILTAARKQHPAFDLAFFDSDLPNRLAELRACIDTELMRPGSYAVFHDTSKVRTTRDGKPDPRTASFWHTFTLARITYSFAEVFEFPLSRGLTIVKL